MAQQNTLRKFIRPPLGVDFTLDRFSRKMHMCEDMLNVDVHETMNGTVLGNRKGYQVVAGGFTDAAYLPHLWDGAAEAPESLCSIFDYHRVNHATGARTSEVILASSTFYRLLTSNVLFAYGGLGTGTVSLLPTPPYGGSLRCRLTDTADPLSPRDFDLGCCESLGADYRLEQMEAAINLLPNWTVTIGTGHEGYVAGGLGPVTTINVDNGAGAAHNLVVGEVVRIPLTGGGVTYRKITAVNPASTNISFDGTPITVDDNAYIRLALVDMAASLLQQYVSGNLTMGNNAVASIFEWDSLYYPKGFGSYLWTFTMAARGADPFVRPCACNMNNNLYMNSFHETTSAFYLKYDGQNVHRAGMPQPTPVTVALAGVGLVDAGLHRYIVTFSHQDKQGNFVEGVPSTEQLITTAPSQVTVNIVNGGLRYGVGNSWPNNYARVRGAQAGVNTIVVDGLDTLSDHCLHVGDYAYFYDAVAAAYTTRNVIAATYGHAGAGGTITIDGAAVNVADNAHITNELRANIYRTMVGGYDYFLVASIPVEVENAATVYTDNIADAALGAQYLFPEVNETHEIAPARASAMTVFQGSVILGGLSTDPNTWTPSNAGGPEYFPSSLSALAGRDANDQIIGMGVLAENLIFFKNRSCYILNGILLDPESVLPQWRLDLFSGTVGCVSHASIINVEGMLFWMDESGPYACSSGDRPIPIGSPVSALILTNKENHQTQSPAYLFDLSKTVSVFDRKYKKVIMNVPAGSAYVTGVQRCSEYPYCSRVFVYDVTQSQKTSMPIWRIWNNVGSMLGAFTIGEDIYHGWNHYPVTGFNFFLGRRLDNDYILDYSATVRLWMDYCDGFHTATPAEFYFVTGVEDFDDPEVDKIFKRFSLYGPQSTYWEDTDFGFTINVDGGGEKEFLDWTTVFSAYGSGATMGDRVKRVRCLPKKTKFAQFRFSKPAGIGNRIQISGWELEAIAPIRPGIGRDG